MISQIHKNNRGGAVSSEWPTTCGTSQPINNIVVCAYFVAIYRHVTPQQPDENHMFYIPNIKEFQALRIRNFPESFEFSTLRYS